MFKKIAYYLSDLIEKKVDIDKKDAAYFNYGIQIVLSVGLEAAIMLFIAYLLNIFWPVLIASLSFLVIRPYAGGVHLPRYFLCMIVTIIVFLMIGWTVSFVELTLLSTLVIITLITVTGLVLINKYAPADTKIVPINDPNQRQLLKNKARIVLISWSFLAVISTFLLDHYLHLIMASALGIFAQLISTHPWFFHIIDEYLPEHK
ncbi:MAG: accessory gene regulator ArgB-like protein [bacterium]